MKLLSLLILLSLSTVYAKSLKYNCKSKYGSELSLEHTDQYFDIIIETERYNEIDENNHFTLEGNYPFRQYFTYETKDKVVGTVYSHNLKGGWWFEFHKKKQILSYVSNKLFLGHKTTFRAKCKLI